MTYMLSMYDILKLKVDVHEALTVGAGWRARGSLGKPRAGSRRQRLFTYFHFFSFSYADLSLIIIHYGLN